MSTTRPEPIRRQSGFAIVAAVFILVVLAALGAYIVSTSNTQSLTQAQDVMNSRVQQAARAGIEWGAYLAVKAPAAPAFRTACEAAVAPATGGPVSNLDLAAGDLPALPEFRVDVDFTWWRVNEGGTAYCVYRIVATACPAAACPAPVPSGVGYVEHRQTATVRQ